MGCCTSCCEDDESDERLFVSATSASNYRSVGYSQSPGSHQGLRTSSRSASPGGRGGAASIPVYWRARGYSFDAAHRAGTPPNQCFRCGGHCVVHDTQLPHEPKDCEYCVTCTACSGTGTRPVMTQRCPECEGAGIVHMSTMTHQGPGCLFCESCPSCRGNGWIRSAGSVALSSSARNTPVVDVSSLLMSSTGTPPVPFGSSSNFSYNNHHLHD
eukprot:TRINITY_DN28885_c0_g1_i1.p1 TRINITY_DN28885_c0_g1~~TRINITY_DN28885_c0_g1_i1.p1  ORF type:complete len:214 (-),score=34.43 TRINITY_DN28885_c0_g1_i1:66-707(-)